MGCYLSAPDDRVYVTEGKDKNFRYSTASCQGWRREQEDAEDCLSDFDQDASLFILCDGHGGAEVAKYTVKHFPNFLKNHPKYKEGNYVQALEEAFIDFDQHLRTKEVLSELEKLAMDSKDDDIETKSNERNWSTNGSDRGSLSNDDQPEISSAVGFSSAGGALESTAGGSSSSTTAIADEPGTSTGPSSSSGPMSVTEDVDSETLRKEATIPIEELINKYTGPINDKRRVQMLRHRQLNINGSPVIKSSNKDDDGDEDDQTDQPSGSSTRKEDTDHSGPSDSGDGPSSTSLKPELELIRKAMEQYFDSACDEEDDDDDSEFDVSESEDDDDDDSDVDENDEEDDEEADSEDEDGDDECEEDADASAKNKDKKFRKVHKRSTSKQTSSSDSDDDDDDAEDIDDEEAEDEDESESDEEEGGSFLASRKFIAKQLKSVHKLPKPGTDSGCTVVVALVKSGMLYVASAGDSRCIVVMKDGQCKAMSYDHKPEDDIELKRIQAAKGYVTEGRVNGGLNLSRAFGDFNYKDENLDPRQQMITPTPDVNTLKLDFNEVEFIFLACDGIWNSMSNAKVAKFIHAAKHSQNKDLIDICMALFRNCLAPNTEGDGTGCDNMTCILVKYYKDENELKQDSQINEQNDLKANIKATIYGSGDGDVSDSMKVESSKQDIAEVDGKVLSAGKRSADLDEADNKQMCKRRCLRLLEE